MRSNLLARITWNIHHPEDQIIGGIDSLYIIHHKDGDPCNDSIENLEKILRGEHNTLHHKGTGFFKKGNTLGSKSSTKFTSEGSSETQRKGAHGRWHSGPFESCEKCKLNRYGIVRIS